MADTSVQHKAEKWVLEVGLPKLYKTTFSGRKVKLNWGGMFLFDAVSEDGTIIGNVSTSSSRTAGNKIATAKIQKIKCDRLYLLHTASVKHRLLIFTELSMQLHFEKEVANGRFPKGVKLIHISLPPELQREVEAARQIASEETSPRRSNTL